MANDSLNVSFTPSAIARIKEILVSESVPTHGGLRVAVLPGGCAGFQYGLTAEKEPAEDDHVLEIEGVRIFVDTFSAQYLDGMTIDYASSAMGSGFVFNNPNSTGGCGCGTSFSA